MKILFLLLLAATITFAQTDSTIVSLRSIDSTIVQDVKYATVNNFTGKVLYPSSIVFLRKVVADSLSKANSYFIKNYDFRIKIFDGYRPLSVQKIMWQIMPNENFVANPAKGSRHNRGAAVDISLIDKAGNELDMGTPYDDFSEKANIKYLDFSPEILTNRNLILNVMKRFGFEPLESEWWHFDFNGWQRFSIPQSDFN